MKFLLLQTFLYSTQLNSGAERHPDQLTFAVASGKKVIDGKDGRYIVECDGKGYTITSENDKSVVRLDFDNKEQSWSVELPSGENYEFMTFIDDTHVSMPTADGTRCVVELSDNGLMAYKEMVSTNYMAVR